MVVVGGGQEALKKIDSLVTQDCKILVLSDRINKQIQDYIRKKKIRFKKMKLRNMGFLSEYRPYLVMATTDDKKLNREIVKKAKKMNFLVYASDDPEVSDFSHPSVINIEDTVQIAISTGGRSPAMARKIKLKAEKIFKSVIQKEDIRQIKLQKIARDAAKKKIITQKERKKFLYSVMNDIKIKQLIKEGKLKNAERRAMKLLSEWE